MAFGTFHSPAPSTPYESMRSSEAEAVIRDIYIRFLGVDWLSRDENARSGGIRSASIFGGHGDRDGWSLQDCVRMEDVRRINLTVQLANSMVSSRQLYAQIHPKLQDDGRYPRDFETPKMVEQFRAMDGSQIDRILIAYRLPPGDMTAARRPGLGCVRSAESMTLPETARGAKLSILFEYLGVDINDSRRVVTSIGGLGGVGRGGFLV